MTPMKNIRPLWGWGFHWGHPFVEKRVTPMGFGPPQGRIPLGSPICREMGNPNGSCAFGQTCNECAHSLLRNVLARYFEMCSRGMGWGVVGGRGGEGGRGSCIRCPSSTCHPKSSMGAAIHTCLSYLYSPPIYEYMYIPISLSIAISLSLALSISPSLPLARCISLCLSIYISLSLYLFFLSISLYVLNMLSLVSLCLYLSLSLLDNVCAPGGRERERERERKREREIDIVQ